MSTGISFDPWAKIRCLAERKHFGQTRKGHTHVPYIVHPADVVRMLYSWGEPRASSAYGIAWGHDLLEDTDATEEEILESSSDAVLRGIKELTRSRTETREQYIHRVAQSIDRNVLLVKAADRLCNAQDFIVEGKREYAKKYLQEASCVFAALGRLSLFDVSLKATDTLEACVNACREEQ